MLVISNNRRLDYICVLANVYANNIFGGNYDYDRNDAHIPNYLYLDKHKINFSFMPTWFY